MRTRAALPSAPALLLLPLLACSSGPGDRVGASGAAIGGFSGCSGLFDTQPNPTGSYYATDFGCSSTPSFTDPGDTCGSASCIQSGFGEGVCDSSQSDAECQRTVNWYSVGGAIFGCGARLQVTNPANGKSVVVMVLDNGPSCTVENDANFWVLDVSYPTIMYLFGSQEGWSDHALINAVQVDSSTPLGPAGSAPPSPGGGGGGGGGGTSCFASSLGQSGSCMLVSDCAAQGGTSTPGLCSGASDIQCCTLGGDPAGADAGPSPAPAPGGGGGGASCNTDGDCNPGSSGSGQICVSGACVAGCNADWQCAGNTTCVGGQCQ